MSSDYNAQSLVDSIKNGFKKIQKAYFIYLLHLKVWLFIHYFLMCQVSQGKGNNNKEKNIVLRVNCSQQIEELIRSAAYLKCFFLI